MNRRRFIAAGAGLGGLAASTPVVRHSPLASDRLRIGLSTVVPDQYRAADRATLTTELSSRLSAGTTLSVDRTLAECTLISGLATERYEIVELGAIAGRMAVAADLATPLVQPQLAGEWLYEGQLLAADRSPTASGPILAGGSPLSTPTYGALAALRDQPPAPTVRWHRPPTEAVLDAGRPRFIASDEFDAPPEATVHTSYQLPVPALYVRTDVGDSAALRHRFRAVDGGRQWFGTVRRATDELVAESADELAGEWLDELSLPSI